MEEQKKFFRVISEKEKNLAIMAEAKTSLNPLKLIKARYHISGKEMLEKYEDNKVSFFAANRMRKLFKNFNDEESAISYYKSIDIDFQEIMFEAMVKKMSVAFFEINSHYQSKDGRDSYLVDIVYDLGIHEINNFSKKDFLEGDFDTSVLFRELRNKIARNINAYKKTQKNTGDANEILSLYQENLDCLLCILVIFYIKGIKSASQIYFKETNDSLLDLLLANKHVVAIGSTLKTEKTIKIIAKRNAENLRKQNIADEEKARRRKERRKRINRGMALVLRKRD